MQQYTAIIIGSGFGGQAAAHNLRQIGVDDFLILERRPWIGGTWSQNSYPGAAVDVQSPLYSLSFEPYPWSQMFAEQHELVEYTKYCIQKHKLADKVRLNADVQQVQWDEARQLWVIDTATQGQFLAKYLINASGPLSTPVIPNFKGRDTFQGTTWHTNNWNHDYALAGKRVAIIGSGASAAQVIPAIAPEVGHLHVFQRTPHWVLPRPDRVFKPWQRALLGNKLIYKALRTAIYWELELRMLGFKYSKLGPCSTSRPSSKTRRCRRRSRPTSPSAANASSCRARCTRPWRGPMCLCTRKTMASPRSTSAAS
jgi:cation diffusion facilitator CzcD-associated flavoprotein CzcO